MKYSELFGKTKKEAPKNETSKNAQLLIRGGFIEKEQNLSQKFFEKLQTLAPFGAGNPEPLLFLENVKLSEIRKVGNTAKHLRAKIGRTKITAIGFGLGEFAEELERRGEADLVFQLSENEWNGNSELQLKVIDLR